MRYEGMNGTIVIQGDLLEIQRDEALARNNDLQRVWRIRLDQITGVLYDPTVPGRSGPGRLSIEVDGRLGPPLNADPIRRDPGTVTLLTRDNEPFAELYRWLLNVVMVNQQRNPPTSQTPEPTRLSRDQVTPPDPVIELTYLSTTGWVASLDGQWLEDGWLPDPGWTKPAGHRFWRVLSPPAAAAATEHPLELPAAWQESGTPSDEALYRWQLASFPGRLDLLNELEDTLVASLILAAGWTDQTDQDAGDLLPDDHPAVLARHRAWTAATGALVAARSWLLRAIAADTAADPALDAWIQRFRLIYQEFSRADDRVGDVLAQARIAGPPGSGWGTPAQRAASNDWQAAEQLAEVALRQFGFTDARCTGAGTDHGLDVVGSTVAAQVKYTSAPVGRPVLQQLQGAAGRRVTVFFARAGFTGTAVDYAETVGMALFELALPGTVRPVNATAIEIANADPA